MAHLPNIPCEATPYGKDEDENIERRRWGTPREFDFDFKPHWDLGTDLDILDLSAATSSPAAVSPFSVRRRPPGARPYQLLPRYSHQPWL